MHQYNTGNARMNQGKSEERQVNMAWFTASLTIIAMLMWGVYGSDAIRDANGERPPMLAVWIFALLVIALLRPALRHHFKTRRPK
jgi:hypothetical protein